MQVRSYKMTTDSGFAPNPFGYALTLATCKPGMRRVAVEGEWIAGFTSVKLNGDLVGKERLIYLMRVAEKIRLCDYFTDPRFQDKIPKIRVSELSAWVCDNIYLPKYPDAELPDQFEQLCNRSHGPADQPSDINGKFVLVAGDFYYFGRNAIRLPMEVRPSVPQGQAGYGRLTNSPLSDRFVRYIRDNYPEGCIGLPHSVPSNPTQFRKSRTKC